MFIYCLTNKNNSKKYIGCTKNSPFERWKEHVRLANKGANILLSRAIRKYGEESFHLDILDLAETREEMLCLEQQYIEELDTFNNGYNMTLGGEGAVGRILTEKHKQKIGESNFGKKRTPEQIEKNRQNKLKNPINYWLGKKMPEYMIDKFKKVHCKPVIQLTKSGDIVDEFDSIKQAQEELKINHISKACRGIYKTAGGFIWRYK